MRSNHDHLSATPLPIKDYEVSIVGLSVEA